MDSTEIIDAIRRRIDAAGTNPYRAAIESGIPESTIRRLLGGADIRLTRLIGIAEALDLELHLGTREELVATLIAGPVDVEPLHPRLALVVGKLLQHWNALPDDYVQRAWLDDFLRTHPYLRELEPAAIPRSVLRSPKSPQV